MARTIAKDYDDKSRLILDRAAKLFAEESFDRASVSSVAKACQISKANIYHYYKSKDDILFDILDNYLSELRDRICSMSLEDLTPEGRLEATILEILLAYKGADNEHRLQAEAIKHLPKKQQDILVGYQRDLVKHVAVLVDGIAPAIFDGDKDKLRAATMSLFGMLNWFYMWNAGAGKKQREDYAQIVSKLCLKGIPGL
ncbi:MULTISPECIES: TetR/AcrR family transcriptional regulator [unclassified Lentilitoribacter]|uniref:TetR/AcrR family transcriptional regulator n=1 Tax=unclassified Lentilitoribacter TaxID=2647570 RepID=UPI0013A6AA7F|nr:TetR/AcrR family transcriptional regulator [Lentilitoribacter sp. Alg239-R112]